MESYGPPPQLLPVLGHAPQPAPAGQTPAGGVEHVEAIAVADARDPAEQAAAAEEARGDVVRARDVAQVGLVEGQGAECEGRGGGWGDPVVRDAEVIADAVDPGLVVLCSGRRRGLRSVVCCHLRPAAPSARPGFWVTVFIAAARRGSGETPWHGGSRFDRRGCWAV
jgi:hypothetical protein